MHGSTHGKCVHVILSKVNADKKHKASVLHHQRSLSARETTAVVPLHFRRDHCCCTTKCVAALKERLVSVCGEEHLVCKRLKHVVCKGVAQVAVGQVGLGQIGLWLMACLKTRQPIVTNIC